EIDVAELDFTAKAIDRHGRRRLCDAGTAVENFEDPAGAVRRAGSRCEELAHRIQPGVKAADEREKNGERADRDLAFRDPPSASRASIRTRTTAMNMNMATSPARSFHCTEMKEQMRSVSVLSR